MLLHTRMRTNLFLLIMMIWFLSLQAFAKSEAVRNGGSGDTSGSATASDADQNIAKARACIKESSAKTEWPVKLMQLREKWLTIELACAPATVKSKAGYAYINSVADENNNISGGKKVYLQPMDYSASNGQYARFINTTHKNLIDESYRDLNERKVQDAGTEFAAKYRSEINASNCEKFLPEYYRAMSYNSDEYRWHIAYELKKEGKCANGPTEPPIILEERSQKVADAVKPYLGNRGALERSGLWNIPKTKTSNTVAKTTAPAAATTSIPGLPLQAGGTCETPNYEQVSANFYNTEAFVFQYTRNCDKQPDLAASINAGRTNFQKIYTQLHANLQSAYETYMRGQGRAPVSLDERRTFAYNKYATQLYEGDGEAGRAGFCQSNKAAYDQITNLSSTEFSKRLKSDACNAPQKVAATPSV